MAPAPYHGAMKGRAIFLLGLVLTAGPAAAQERCAAEPVASVPLQQKDGNLLVEVTVNDQPAVFILDTGGVTTVLSTRLVERLNLATRRNFVDVIVRDAGGARAARFTTVNSLQLGARRIPRRNYMIAPLRDGIDGLLAPDLWRLHDLDLDLGAQRMSLYPTRACAGSPPGNGAFSAVPMDTKGWARRIRIETMLDGKTLWASVDTGARRTYVAASAAQEIFGIRMPGSSAKARGIFGGELTVAPHDFSVLRIGDIVWEKPSLALATPENGFDGAPILLGLEQLQGLRLFAAYGEDKLYITPARQP